MKLSKHCFVLVALSVVVLGTSMPVLAADPTMGQLSLHRTPPVSDRLIVKFKPNNLPAGLSVSQIGAQLSQPLSVQTVSQMQVVAGAALTELHAISNGAHVMAIAGQPNRQVLNNAIAGISSMPNVEYVQEDRILTIQTVPNDTYYTNALPYVGLWGMWPVNPAAASAVGNPSSYGADFQTAWNSVTGANVVVAVVDTGITPHVDIVGPAGTVAAGAGSNLISTGYDFTSDCRTRGTCPATQPTATAAVAPSPNATDLGDFITSADAASLYFSGKGCTVASDSSWHGTHVAGTIAALGNNNAGVIGGAYNAKILPVRVLGKCGGYTSDIVNGITWAAGLAVTGVPINPNPAKVINLSLGGLGTCSSDPAMQNAINAVVAAGAVVVVAAGNSSADVANFEPASCQNVISVAAIGRDGSRASYSNYSSPTSNTAPVNVTLAAQGGDQSRNNYTYDPGILSTLNSSLTTPALSSGSNYVWYQGTSMATPHVAAAAALMLSRNPALTPAQIKTIVSAPSSLTAFPSFVSGSYPVLNGTDCTVSNNCGAGILNANLAVLNSVPTVTAPAASDFGAVAVNSGTLDHVVTLTNKWLTSAQVGTATVTGTNAAQFVIAIDSCSGATIASNGTCQITVSYVPTVAGAHTATLTVPIVGAASPTLVSLIGVTGAPLAVTTPVTAATVNVGQSTTVNLSYTNPNITAWRVGAVSLSQPAIMATSVDNCSNTTIAAGASCSITVTITPATVGAYSGTASLSLFVGGTPAVATISGAATAASAVPASGGGGGGGCSVMPAGADPDISLLLAMLAVWAYWFRRRVVRALW
jgi:serine protease